MGGSWCMPCDSRCCFIVVCERHMREQAQGLLGVTLNMACVLHMRGGYLVAGVRHMTLGRVVIMHDMCASSDTSLGGVSCKEARACSVI